MRQNFLIALYGVALAFFLFSGTAMAHKVTVFAWVEGDTVYGETKFSGGRKAMDSEILVLDTEGNELLRTRTNDKGEFSFKVPKRTGMRIELMAGMGHKASWTIPVEEIPEDAVPGGTPTDGTAVAAAASAPEKSAPDKDAVQIPATPAQTASMPDRAELEVMIEKTMDKALEKKLKPMMIILADLEQQEPSVSDVVGGIGYILGLMGVAMYFKFRQRKG